MLRLQPRAARLRLAPLVVWRLTSPSSPHPAQAFLEDPGQQSRLFPLTAEQRRHVDWWLNSAAGNQVGAGSPGTRCTGGNTGSLHAPLHRCSVFFSSLALPFPESPLPCPCTAPKPQVVIDTINEGRPYKLRVAKTKAAWEARGQEGRRLLGLAVRLEGILSEQPVESRGGLAVPQAVGQPGPAASAEHQGDTDHPSKRPQQHDEGCGCPALP